ncbi:ABC transporter [Clostridium carboxidivorans P7]|uniref:ABC transporter related protein n=1 Tax=Clostridium carboxidivorans P7 TaxID=536227 RepID=C6PQ19_9CLOT|nr:ABC transporter ATP-binding protein [Clostridium carboxidivorans]AKN29656.1 ABC transporter [Clostridium carboxidivorans P7]EET88624.1 ABC transporter related protein [Clostridium carboxidivorans P7]EFG89414.1 ABC transporter, ATP-binding protein [Clostridium carboxidivorans P7]
MRGLLKYLKPFIGLIIAAIALLFVQAMCDLALPDYMSNIVNVGIQQGGIENAVPQAVRKSEMDKLTLFIFGKDKDAVMSNYVFVDKSSKDYDKYVKEYPVLVSEPIYVLKNVSNTEINKLNPIIGKALLTVSGIENMKTNAKGGVINFNGRKLPANTNLFALFGRLPEDQRGKIMEEGAKKFTALGDKMIVQAAASSVKVEYKALGINTDKIQNSYIINIGVRMILISLLSAVCIVAVGFFASRTAAGLSRNLRSRIFAKVQSFSNAEMNKFSTASLITRTTNDITQIQMLIVIMIRMIFYAPIIGIGGVIKAMSRSTSMSWIIALAVAALLIVIIAVIFVAMPKFKIIQKLIDKLNLVTRENLSGMMVVRAFNTQKFEEERFDKANKDLTDTSLFVNRVMVVLFPFMMLIMNGVTVLIIWVGAQQIANSSMQVGDMMAFMQYAMQILFAFLMMSFMFIMIPRASVAGQRIVEVLETDTVINDPKSPKNFDNNLKGIVEFNNVSFRYPGAEEDVLKNISFKALPGQTTAIIGATGSGKTTLISLIPRFYDVTDGQLFVDGVDVREVTQHDLRDKVGYVPQKGNLFSGTIESNLKYAKENAEEEDLREASEIAQAMEFINDKPDGFKTEISQGGTNVSGGQKQRLAIARALVKKPEIFIFDDSFSALDFKTDAALRKALKAKTSSTTVIIVAQRIATIKNAEQIIVLDEGKIVGTGTNKQLMETCETYKEIALSQLSKEELA